jgi:hypothetical protein
MGTLSSRTDNRRANSPLVQPIAFSTALHFVAAHRDSVLRPALAHGPRAFSHERMVVGEALTSVLIRSGEAFSRISF